MNAADLARTGPNETASRDRAAKKNYASAADAIFARMKSTNLL